MNHYNRITFVAIFGFSCLAISMLLLQKKVQSETPQSYTTETIWGSAVVENPLTRALLKSPAMERIKHIDQSGPLVYFGLAPEYRRYDHCVGVWDLVRRFGGSDQEQAAALLHDASHTVFSHVADHLFHGREKEHSYQDEIHLWFLEKMGIEKILKEHGIDDISILNPDNPDYRRLEQPSPGLCADRIEYLLHTGILFEKLTKEEQASQKTTLKISTKNGLVSCGINENEIFENIKTTSVSGGSGIMIWDNLKLDSIEILSFVIKND